MKMDVKALSSLLLALMLTSCSYNPLSGNNHTTGSPVGALAGAGIGAGGAAVLGGTKPVIGIAGLVGGIVGYYTTTQRFDAGGVMQAGGNVYNVGQYVGIYIPTDKLFEPNTADFLPQSEAALDSAADILERYPNNSILVSGNSSGFGRTKWEQSLSEKRAERVAAYLWNAGINNFKIPCSTMRRLTYVGYGDYFPIASNHDNNGIRENSRIQITSYPSNADLHLDSRHVTMHNIGALEDSPLYKD